MTLKAQRAAESLAAALAAERVKVRDLEALLAWKDAELRGLLADGPRFGLLGRSEIERIIAGPPTQETT